jgi:hypothetical protein
MNSNEVKVKVKVRNAVLVTCFELLAWHSPGHLRKIITDDFKKRPL